MSTLTLQDRLARVEAKLSFLSVTFFRTDYLELSGKALSGAAWIVRDIEDEVADIYRMESERVKGGVK